jgi:hypothetical protein
MTMTSALQLTIASAALLAIFGAIFGVCAARMVWGDDLKQAQIIDRLRSQKEAAMERTIYALEGYIILYEPGYKRLYPDQP